MALSDGDLFVSGSILSYQQANRIYQNFRAATVPTALQAGGLWSDSDDDRLWHKGASELLEVFTEKTTLTFENLLSNSGFGVWSQSDAAKGLASLTYDAGAKGAGAAPSVGDAAVGGTSGATGKVISYTTATGAWATNDATGVFTLGAVTGTFQDNETVTFGGVETALVNGDEAIGITNDPMNNDDTADWTLVDCTLAFDTDHYEITRTAISQVISKVASLTVGKIYKIEIDIKDGTEAGVDAVGYCDNITGTIAYPTYTTAAGWVSVSWTFEAESTDATAKVGIASYLAGAANIEIKNFSCYEITPCCTAADTVAMDGWLKDSTVDIYREHSGGNVQDGSFYANKLVITAASDYVRFPGAVYDNAEWYMQFQGRTITVGKWVKTSTASHAKLTITDSAGSTSSSFHTGGGTYEWLEVTRAINASATSVAFYVYGDIAANVDGSTIIYHCQGMLVFGSHIGEGNYQPKQQEIIYPETSIDSKTLGSKTSLGDVAWTALNLEADTDGKLPKGIKKVVIYSSIKDSGSAASASYIRLRGNSTTGAENRNSCGGLTNDVSSYIPISQPCNPDGDIEYTLEASGADTLDITYFRYMAVQLN